MTGLRIRSTGVLHLAVPSAGGERVVTRCEITPAERYTLGPVEFLSESRLTTGRCRSCFGVAAVDPVQSEAPGFAMVLMDMLNHHHEMVRVGSVLQGQRPGSFSSDGPPRELYLFGWLPDSGDLPGVWRSIDDLDINLGPDRPAMGVSTKLVADLREGPFRIAIQRSGGERRLRFSLQP